MREQAALAGKAKTPRSLAVPLGSLIGLSSISAGQAADASKGADLALSINRNVAEPLLILIEKAASP